MPHPHVLIFPLPLQGPVNSMLKLAELLCLQDIQVTFLNSENVQQRLRNYTDTENYFKKYEKFSFKTVPDGLSDDNPRTGGEIRNMLEAMDIVTMPIFRAMVGLGGVCGPDSETPLTCILADGIFTYAVSIAEEIGVPLLYFDTISPCALWTHLCLPKLIETGEFPFKDDNMDEFISCVPGMEGIIRRRDLPVFCRAPNPNDPIIKLILNQAKHIPLAHGLILNTFEELEAPVLAQFRNLGPKVYAIGPLQANLKARLATGKDSIMSHNTNSNSIWKEDQGCISWLDEQPCKSVLYVSIGSLASMTKDQLFEIWHGLVNSGSRFLWAQRPGSIIGLESSVDIPVDLAYGTKERGYIVDWVPQEVILAHPAIGGFLTHSGWNSTLESVVEGKPMICWPYFFDQHMNSRYVGEVWKVGLDMKDTCDRRIIEINVREVMESMKDEFLGNANKLAQSAKASVTEGGSSFMDLDHLVKDIKSMTVLKKEN